MTEENNQLLTARGNVYGKNNHYGVRNYAYFKLEKNIASKDYFLRQTYLCKYVPYFELKARRDWIFDNIILNKRSEPIDFCTTFITDVVHKLMAVYDTYTNRRYWKETEFHNLYEKNRRRWRRKSLSLVTREFEKRTIVQMETCLCSVYPKDEDFVLFSGSAMQHVFQSRWRLFSKMIRRIRIGWWPLDVQNWAVPHFLQSTSGKQGLSPHSYLIDAFIHIKYV